MIKIALGLKQLAKKQCLTNKMFTIYRFKAVDSTNSLARDYPPNSIILAEEQKKGKGRFNRRWHSKKGGLWFSIILKPERRIFEYTFITSLAILKSLKIKAKIKWPNDIMYNNKKICGILSQLISQGTKNKVIVGIGINVNNQLPRRLGKKATSLRKIKKKSYDLIVLLNNILNNFEYLSKKEFKDILSEYKKNCLILNKSIRVCCLQKNLSGNAVDIDYDGNLILEKDGKTIKLNEGDVSIL